MSRKVFFIHHGRFSSRSGKRINFSNCCLLFEHSNNPLKVLPQVGSHPSLPPTLPLSHSLSLSLTLSFTLFHYSSLSFEVLSSFSPPLTPSILPYLAFSTFQSLSPCILLLAVSLFLYLCLVLYQSVFLFLTPFSIHPYVRLLSSTPLSLSPYVTVSFSNRFCPHVCLSLGLHHSLLYLSWPISYHCHQHLLKSNWSTSDAFNQTSFNFLRHNSNWKFKGKLTESFKSSKDARLGRELNIKEIFLIKNNCLGDGSAQKQLCAYHPAVPGSNLMTSSKRTQIFFIGPAILKIFVVNALGKRMYASNFH